MPWEFISIFINGDTAEYLKTTLNKPWISPTCEVQDIMFGFLLPLALNEHRFALKFDDN